MKFIKLFSTVITITTLFLCIITIITLAFDRVGYPSDFIQYTWFGFAIITSLNLGTIRFEQMED